MCVCVCKRERERVSVQAFVLAYIRVYVYVAKNGERFREGKWGLQKERKEEKKKEEEKGKEKKKKKRGKKEGRSPESYRHAHVTNSGGKPVKTGKNRLFLFHLYINSTSISLDSAVPVTAGFSQEIRTLLRHVLSPATIYAATNSDLPWL